MYAEPGSFRDHDSRIYYDEQGVVRALSAQGLEDWEALSASSLYSRFLESANLVGGELVEADGLSKNGWAAFLRHERIPFVSYPYEWTFSMLKDAALLELDLVLASLDEELILKDASPYNVQWRGARPVFIDVGSFERQRPGEAWAGYRQFCMLFLYPLLLQAYRGVPFQPWLRGSLEGIDPRSCRRLLRSRDLLRRGVFTHVVLHERLERRHGARGGTVRGELASAGFGNELIKANVSKLRKLVSRLEVKDDDSAWTDYRDVNTYSDDAAERKAEVVRRTIAMVEPKLVWDLGCNDGRYARIAAEEGAYTLAIDTDERTVDRLYRALAAEDDRSILPLVADVADPSPALGWRNLERKTLTERGRPDLILCLALVHHLVITRNIPMRSFLEWLRTLESVVLFEFPSEDDPMVLDLLAAKRAGTHGDYSRAGFERYVTESFVVEDTTELSATRSLYRLHPAK